MAYTKYSLTPANNNAAPPDGAPEGMLPSAVNDTMRDMMAQIRDCGDGIRGGTYTMTAPVITGGSISGTTFSSSAATITGGSINGTPIGASTASTGKFSTLTVTGLTATRIPFMGTGGLFSDNGNLTWDGTNLNAFALKSATLDSPTTLTLKGGGVSAMVINGSGQVAVGGATAIGKFAIGSSTGSVGVALQPTNGTGIYAYYNTDGTYGYLASSSGTTGNKISFKLDAPDSSLVINSSGNVGIGTDSPSYKLQVRRAGGVASLGINLDNTVGFTRDVQYYSIADSTSDTTGHAFYVRNGTATDNLAMRINNSGALSIGTSGNISTEKLTVVTSTTSVAAFFRNSKATSGDVVLGLWTDAAKDTSNDILSCINNAQSGNGKVAIIYGNGNIQNINNSYGAISDVKLKENIVDATPKLDDLMKVKVRNYNLIGDENKQIGVVAQELESVFAGLVEESIDTDKEGNILETTTKSVKYSVFVPMLIKAIQELNAKVIALEAQLAAK